MTTPRALVLFSCLWLASALFSSSSASAEEKDLSKLRTELPSCKVAPETAAACEEKVGICQQRLSLVEQWAQDHNCDLSDGSLQKLIGDQPKTPAPTAPIPPNNGGKGGGKKRVKKTPKPAPAPLMVVVGDPVEVPPSGPQGPTDGSNDQDDDTSSESNDGHGKGSKTASTGGNVAAGGPVPGSCPNGGQKWPIGLDHNRNGKLDPAEIGPGGWITVCTQRGADGANALLEIDNYVGTEYAGQQCQRFTSWSDLDRDGKRSDGETVSVKETCQPKPAAAPSFTGRVGHDGEAHRLNVGFGMRHIGLMPDKFLSFQPEVFIGFWITPEWKVQMSGGYLIERQGGDGISSFVTEACYRGANSSLGFCGGFAYVGWGLLKNQAASQTMAIDLSLEWAFAKTGRWEFLVRPAVMAGLNGYVQQGRHFAFGESIAVSVATHVW